MFRLLTLLILTVFTHQTTLAQSTYHVIQVGTFIDAQHDDFEALRSIGFVHANNLGGNLVEVYIGGFRDKAGAEQVLKQVQKKGYPNAFIQDRSISSTQVATVIQMATRQATKPIEWEEFERVGNLFAILNGSLVKIVTGPYASSGEAQQALRQVKSLGYEDAFVKNVNAEYLHPVTTFETGVKKGLLPMSFDYSAPKGDIPEGYDTGTPNYTNNNTPSEYTILQPSNPGSPTFSQPQVPSMDIPGSYDYYGDGSTTPKAAPGAYNVSNNYTSQAGMPAINGKLKRSAALDLQKILKAKGAYTGSLDGYYGNGTKSAYESFASSDRLMQKYKFMAEQAPLPGTEGGDSQLQAMINNLPNDISTVNLLRNRNEAVAQAYVAYQQFIQYGPGNEVNELMVGANRAAFAGQSVTNLPFDPNATYSYQDMGQLILHLHYIHAADRTKESVPCWIRDRHPQEAARAMQSSASFVGSSLKLQSCGQFESWPEVRMLVMAASDLNTDTKLDQNRLSQAASERSRLYLAPKALNNTEQKAVERWQGNLIGGLNAWGTRDPLHQRMVTTFRVLFFQSQVRLEDYFMQKGYKQSEAKGLALATLHTLVAYHTQRFV
jgi:hypothetical protein